MALAFKRNDAGRVTDGKAGDRFEVRLKVVPADIDQLGHVNNIVYLRWVQEAAVAHWRAVAPPAEQEGLFWVVVRHEIDYKRPAFLGDEIVAYTWVGTATRRTFERHTELIRVTGRRLLAKALTLWCPMDAKSGKPTDVSDAVRTLFSVPARQGSASDSVSAVPEEG